MLRLDYITRMLVNLEVPDEIVNMMRGWGGVRHGNGFSRVTSSFHTLSAVCCGKILVFIQYIISI